MEITFIAALIVAIPLILFPVALVWYLNIGGVMGMARKTLEATQKTHEAITK